MKKLFSLFVFASLGAQVCLDDLCLDADIVPRGTWQGRGEILYWRPDAGGFDYAFATNSVGRQRDRVLRGENHFGWRLGLGYTSCDEYWSVLLSGLVLHARNDAKTPDRLSAFDLIADPVVRGRLEQDYGNVDLRFSRYVWLSEQAGFDLFAGVRSSWLRELRRARTTVSRARERMNFWGIGPELGIGGFVSACEGFELRGRLGVLALIGNRSHILDATTVARRFPSETVVVPALEFRLAVSYWQEVDCFLMRLTAGFEHHHYFNPVAPTLSAVSTSQRIHRDLGFGGPFIGLQVNY